MKLVVLTNKETKDVLDAYLVEDYDVVVTSTERKGFKVQSNGNVTVYELPCQRASGSQVLKAIEDLNK